MYVAPIFVLHNLLVSSPISMRLRGKVALITGGTSGIGAATAKLFSREGAKTVITGRSRAKGEDLAAQHGLEFIEADVTLEADIKRSIETTVSRFGRLDILFNNAGAPVGPASVEDITASHIESGTKLLLTSVMLGTRYAAEQMKANGGGSIINNSSIAALRLGQGSPLYSALKAAVSHWTRVSGVELGKHGIRVNSISPGAIATPIFWGGSARADELMQHAATCADFSNALLAVLRKMRPSPRAGK